MATPPKGDKNRTRGSTVEEKTLKFRFPPLKDNDGNVNPRILHVHWMHEVQTAFGEDIQFFDNNNRKIGKLDPLRTTPESQTHHFAVHTSANTKPWYDGSIQEQSNDARRNSTRFIIHRIQT